MHVVRSIEHERPSLQQMAKWRNLPGVVHWGLHVVLPRVHGINEGLLSFSVPFVLLSCSRVCLLVLSRLHGLTLRPSAPVCCCQRDSLTRGRLAIVQEAVRVFFFSVFSIGVARDDMCPVVPGNLREMSLQAMLKFEGPAASLNCFSLFPPFLESALFLTVCSGDAWARTKCVTSWCVECTLQDCGERIRRTY